MPYVMNRDTRFQIEVTADKFETCSRCEGKGWYNYFDYESQLKIMFYRLIGALRCIQCGGRGKTLTEQGRDFVERKESQARWGDDCAE